MQNSKSYFVLPNTAFGLKDIYLQKSAQDVLITGMAQISIILTRTQYAIFQKDTH